MKINLNRDVGRWINLKIDVYTIADQRRTLDIEA